MADEVTVESDVSMVARDGVKLRADVYRGSSIDNVPALLCRTSYNKGRASYVKTAHTLAHLGYVVVVQDLRGCHASDGTFDWIFNAKGNETEASDGYDAVEWAARLPGVDGRVGTWGTSYPSACAWRLAGTQPPSLAGMFTSGMAAHSTDMTRGVLDIGRRLQWAHSLAAEARRRSGASSGPRTEAQAADAWDRVERGKWIWWTPLASIPEDVFGDLTPQLHQYYREVAEDHWQFDQVHRLTNVPVACLTGWWDRLIGTINNYTGMIANGPVALNAQHRLWIGPWSHDTDQLHGQLGPRDYGAQAGASFPQIVARFFDRIFKNHENGRELEAPVQVFILNLNQWIAGAKWPLEGSSQAELFLSSNGAANTPFGNGRLMRQVTHDEPCDNFTYDPHDPVMSLMALNSQAMPCDQSLLDGRCDVLVYQTSPLEEDMLVVGPMRCHLWAASDAPDTDFTVKLVEVGLDGLAINLSWGIMRARYRNGFDREELLEPGKPTEFVIEMTPVGILFQKGSRIRLDVSSSDFPSFDRNHNTGRTDFWADAEMRKAKQQVFHSLEYPSRLIFSTYQLPIDA